MAKTTPTIPAIQFIRSPTLDPLAPVYAFVGADAYLQFRAFSLLRDHVLAPDLPGSSLTEFDSAADPRPIFDALRTTPFFGMEGYRLVLVRDGDRLVSSSHEPLLRILQSPPPDGILALFAGALPPKGGRGRRSAGGAGKSDSSPTRAARAIAKAGCVVTCDKLNRRTARDWLGLCTRRLRLRLAPPAAQALLEAAGPDAGAIEQELEKLATFAADGSPLSTPDVEALVGLSRTHAIYNLTDALNERNAAEAVRIIDQLLLAGQSIPAVVASLARNYRLLWKVLRLHRAGLDRAGLAREIALPPWRADLLLRQIARIRTEEHLARRIRRLAEADVESKTRSIHQESRRWLECLVLELCALP
jgi:DNA polymerase-3 subunit delta